jgi:membrane protease YdiL (CAAX protease family)
MEHRSDLKQALIVFAAVFVAVAGLVRLDFELAIIGHVGSALVAVTLLYTPLLVAWYRREDLAIYGFVVEPLRKGLVLGLGVPLLIFPVFVVGYLAFYEIACSTSLSDLAPPGLCARFVGWQRMAAPVMNLDLAHFAMVQLVVVALPEELFFRGCLLHLLEKAIPPRRRLLGGGVGWALVISAAMFALIHLPKDGDPRSLATFFPGLLFGWMRSASGSILASTIAHASSNVLIRVLDQMVLR